MKVERRAHLDAMAVLYRLCAEGSERYFQNEVAVQYEAMLERQAVEAQSKLDGYRRSKAMHNALDAALPGWFCVDASEYLPKEKWHAFVSDDADEWTEWLVSNGVERKIAEGLVLRAALAAGARP